MKKIISFILAAVMLFALIPMAGAASEPKEVTLAFSGDLHSYGLPHNILIDNAETETGGYARRKTLLDALKAKKDTVFVLDGGDFAMGTLLQSIYSEKAAELVLMGETGIQVTTFGNHEFDFYDSGLNKMLIAAAKSGKKVPELVCANLIPSADAKDGYEKFGVKEYTVIEQNGIKIAVFGLLGAEAYTNAPLTKFEYLDMQESAKKTVEKIKQNEKVDMIVCLSHSGLSGEEGKTEDETLAKNVPGIDVILSAHSHTLLKEPITIGNTHIVASGEYGSYFCYADLSKNASGRWDIKDYSVELITKDVKEDETIAAMLDSFYKDIDELYLSKYGYSLSSTVATSDFDFATLDEMQSVYAEQPLGNMIADSYVYAVNKELKEGEDEIDLSVTALGVIRSSFTKGDIGVEDIYNVSSLGVGMDGLSGYPLVSIYITGKEIKTLAEVDVSVSRIMGAAQLYMSGVAYEYNPNRLILNRVTDVWLVGKNGERIEIEDDKLYRGTCGMYAAQMLGEVKKRSFGLLSIVPKNADGNAYRDV